MQAPIRWDDLSLLLAIRRHGSLSRAAGDLGCDASTVSRRLRNFEQSLGASLFARTPDGLLATELAHRLMPHAERAEAAVLDATAEMAGTDRKLEGTVRVAMPGGFAAYMLAPRVREFLDLHPKIRLELIVGTSLVDMSRHEADIAIRFIRPTSGDVVCKRVASNSPLRVVATQAYAESLAPGDAIRWIGWVPEFGSLPDAVHLRSLTNEMPRIACNDMVTMVECLRGDGGAMLLPRAVLRSYPDLTEIDGFDLPDHTSSTWLVCHRALRDVPRVAATWDWFEALIQNSLSSAP